MDLNPNTWHVDRVHVRRKAAVRVEDVLADVARTGDHGGTVLSRFLQKTLPEIAVVDFGEQLRILVDARYSKLTAHDLVDRASHGSKIGWTLCLDQVFVSRLQADGMGPQVRHARKWDVPTQHVE